MSAKKHNKVLHGKNCFITGATGGIGRALSRKFAEIGCNLFLTATNNEKLAALQKELAETNKGSRVFFKSGDLCKVKDIDELIAEATAKSDTIDILINCAGVFPVKALRETSIADFDRCFDINVKAPFIFCKAFSRHMTQNKWGRIVNIGSSSSYAGFKETSAYCSSKHALLGFSRSLYDELKEDGIRVFCVCPGSAKTKMGEQVKGQSPESFIEPSEIAEYVAFIISFDNEMVSEEIKLNRIRLQ